MSRGSDYLEQLAAVKPRVDAARDPMQAPPTSAEAVIGLGIVLHELLTELVQELRCGQAPMMMVAKGVPVWIMPHQIVAIERTNERTWIHTTGGRDYFVDDLPEDIAHHLWGGAGEPVEANEKP